MEAANSWTAKPKSLSVPKDEPGIAVRRAVDLGKRLCRWTAEPSDRGSCQRATPVHGRPSSSSGVTPVVLVTGGEAAEAPHSLLCSPVPEGDVQTFCDLQPRWRARHCPEGNSIVQASLQSHRVETDPGMSLPDEMWNSFCRRVAPPSV